jgi:hypothetical protein
MRDLGRCAFVGTAGKRCDERGFLEFHHVTPFALGGEASFDNIQLRCRRHNAYEARLYFGDDGRTRSGTSSPTAALSRPGRLDRAGTLEGTVAPKGRAP